MMGDIYFGDEYFLQMQKQEGKYKMAYNKDNYENNRLTSKQEAFCQQIAMRKNTI